MRDRIEDLVAFYPSCRRLICEYVIQWLPTVASQCQAIKEAIETDHPCSDDFMKEIGPEQGLPSTVSDRSSSGTRSQIDPPSPDADKALAENANRIPEPFPTPSSSMREQSLEDYQDRGQECEGSNRSQAPREPPCSQPPSDDAEKACADKTPKPARPKQRLAKRSAECGKEGVSKKRKTTVRQLPTIVDCKFSAAGVYGHLLNCYRNPDTSWLLTRLFFAVASPEAFVQAKDTYRNFQSGNIQIHLSRTSTVSDHMKYLDRLVSSLIACRVIERSILVQLVNRRDELVQKFKAEPDRRMRKTTEAKSQSRLQRVDGLALSMMMEEAFPMLKTGADDYN